MSTERGSHLDVLYLFAGLSSQVKHTYMASNFLIHKLNILYIINRSLLLILIFLILFAVAFCETLHNLACPVFSLKKLVCHASALILKKREFPASYDQPPFLIRVYFC